MDRTPKKTRAPELICFFPKSKTEDGFGEFKTDHKSIFERMAKACGRAPTAAIVGRGNPSVMHGAKATTFIGCGSDREVLDGLIQVIPAHEFLFWRFADIADAVGCECTLLGCVGGDSSLLVGQG